MAPQPGSPILQAQIDSLEKDFENLWVILESPTIKEAAIGGKVGLTLNMLSHQLKALDTLSRARVDESGAWAALTQLQGRSRQLMEDVQEILGGLAIRNANLDRGMTARAQELVRGLSGGAGLDWRPEVIISQATGPDWPEGTVVEATEADSIVRLPIPRWDLWYLPLLAHDCGYWVAKRGQFKALDQWVEDHVGLVLQLLKDSPPEEPRLACCLPEIREMGEIRRYSGNLEEFLRQYQAGVELLALRQKVHLWHLVADAFATYSMGPAYVHALIFLKLNPTNPFSEGERASGVSPARSRYLPSDARRASTALETLREMDRQAKEDPKADGPYAGELKLLESVWEQALNLTGNLERYRQMKTSMAALLQSLNSGLEYHFRYRRRKTEGLWQEAIKTVVPVIRQGTQTVGQPTLEVKKVSLPYRIGMEKPKVEKIYTDDALTILASAGWWCRARFSDSIPIISKLCEQLLSGNTVPGLLTEVAPNQEHARRLVFSRLHDLKNDLRQLESLFRSEKIDKSDREAVAGRFYRLLSKQFYNYSTLRKSKDGPLAAALDQVLRGVQSSAMEELQREVLDFLGGVLMRQEGLDQGVCTLAEALLQEYMSLTGVNWSSRVILGKKPIFSLASDIIHLRFPDTDIWNLPLLAHEFGHMVNLVTPDFQRESHWELASSSQGHPEFHSWDKEKQKAYADMRGWHLQEFFADAFAVYCQGPAYALNVVMLHFNPWEAFLARDFHPTHSERVEVIMGMLKKMNDQEKQDEHGSDPYFSLMQKLRNWWSQSVERKGLVPDPIMQYHLDRAKAWTTNLFTLVDTYYYLGARYPAKDWQRAEDISKELLEKESEIAQESLRNLLNISWASRIRHPEQVPTAARLIWRAMKERHGID